MERQELPSRACTQGPRVSPRGWGQSDGDEARGAGRKLMPHVGRQRGRTGAAELQPPQQRAGGESFLETQIPRPVPWRFGFLSEG